MSTQGSAMRSPITLPIQQFKVIYQVIKEIPNVAWERAPEELGSQEIIDQVLRVARSARRAAKDSEASMVEFTTPEAHLQSEEFSATVEHDNGVTIVHASATAGHLSLWPSIVDFISRSLGEREAFLRTGYTTVEISSATAHLSENVKKLSE